MTAYLAGSKGLSLLRLDMVTLAFTSAHNLKKYTHIDAFENGKIKVTAEYEGESDPLAGEIDLHVIGTALHLSSSFINSITDIKLEEV